MYILQLFGSQVSLGLQENKFFFKIKSRPYLFFKTNKEQISFLQSCYNKFGYFWWQIWRI